MAAREAARRIDELRAEIAHHDYRYYVLDDPEVRLLPPRLTARGSTGPVVA